VPACGGEPPQPPRQREQGEDGDVDDAEEREEHAPVDGGAGAANQRKNAREQAGGHDARHHRDSSRDPRYDAAVEAPPTLLRADPGSKGVYELCHPLGLRGLAALPGASLEAGADLRAEVTALHLLECQADVERELARPGGPRLSLALRGPLSFSGDELARLAPGVTLAQIEGAVRLLLGWQSQAPDRLEARLGASFVGLTPWTTRLDLRRHLDGLHRHQLALDPLAPLVLDGKLAERARSEGLLVGSAPGFAFEDEDVGPIVAQAQGASGPERQERLRRALDQAAGVPRGEKKKHLRLLPAPRYDERRPARTGQVELTRAPELRPARQRAAEAIAAVRRVARDGARELLLGGSAPVGEWYLDDLVALARSLRFERIVLEADAAALAEPGRAQALARAGLTAARVALDTPDDAIALAGARALLDAGVAVELAVTLEPSTPGALARIVEEAPRRLPASRARVERVVARHVPGTISVAAAAREMLDGARASSRSGLPLAVAPGSALPPCVFADLEAAASVLHLGEGRVEGALDAGSRDHVRIALCEGCGARHVCPGSQPALAAEVLATGRRVPPGAPGVPLTRERERVLRELRSVLFKTGRDGKVEEHRVLRVNFHCNQACDFCFVSRELPPPEDALLQAELAEVARRGASLAISGGEPTLNPRLAEYLARTVELGITDVQLQTNAIKMSDPAYTAELVQAGLRRAFVSLHGISAETSDRVTAAPGTFVRTLAGIRNLTAAGVSVCLNFVLCAYNADELAGLPDFVAREIGLDPPGRVEINFSFVAAGSENVPRDTGLIPRFSDVAWALEAALARARALGVPLLGFDSQCGVPACFLPEEVRAAWFVEDLPEEEIGAFAGAFRKGEACARCALTRRCYGLRTAYAETYGTGELRAVGEPPSSEPTSPAPAPGA